MATSGVTVPPSDVTIRSVSRHPATPSSRSRFWRYRRIIGVTYALAAAVEKRSNSVGTSQTEEEQITTASGQTASISSRTDASFDPSDIA